MKCENPKCGKEHDGSYGSGRFCSNHCRCAFNASKAKHGTLKSKCAHPKLRAPYGTWKCSKCNEVFETRRKLRNHREEVHPELVGHVWNKGLTKESDVRVAKISSVLKSGYLSGQYVPFFKGKKMPISSCEKMSKIAKDGYKNGTRFGWRSRKITSFPEEFWKRVLDNNHISYQVNFPVSRKSLGDSSSKSYFLDFKIGTNIDLEIDGAQHRFRKEHDEKRDKLLTNGGYKIYRIPWNEINSESGKYQMAKKIDDFLKWLNKQL